MRAFHALVLFAAISIASAASAAAQVQVSFGGGRVSVVAREATLADILTEWARVGQVTIANADVLPRERVTIELRDASEEQAIAVLLRRASGYLAAPRATDLPGAARFDRILVMRASAPPAPARAAATPAPTLPGDPAPVDPDADAVAPAEPGSGDTSSPRPDPGAGEAARDASARPRARAPEPGAAAGRYGASGGLPVNGSLAARQRASEQARADGGIGGDETPPVTVDPAPRGFAVPRAPDLPPARPMPAGQMTERRASAGANQAARDRPLSPAAPATPAFDEGVDPSQVTGDGIPAQDSKAQEAFKRRQAVEVVDPRTFKFQLPAPVATKPTAPGAARPGVVTKGPGQ
jgi:hypothetical protein